MNKKGKPKRQKSKFQEGVDGGGNVRTTYLSIFFFISIFIYLICQDKTLDISSFPIGPNYGPIPVL